MSAVHDHDHEHHDEYRPSEISLRVKAIELLLVEKKLLDPVAVDKLVDAYENKIGPHNGARVVAKAWTDPEYKKRLLGDGTKAILELGYSGIQGEDMVVVENTPEVHNMVVCTLCSCYPWPTLGLPPELVQGASLQVARGDRPAGRFEGVWRRASEGRRGARLGQQRGASLPGSPGATGRRRRT